MSRMKFNRPSSAWLVLVWVSPRPVKPSIAKLATPMALNSRAHISMFRERAARSLEQQRRDPDDEDDLKLAVWFQSNQDGAALAARVVFPNQIDPATGTHLTVLLDGDPSGEVREKVDSILIGTGCARGGYPFSRVEAERQIDKVGPVIQAGGIEGNGARHVQ